MENSEQLLREYQIELFGKAEAAKVFAPLRPLRPQIKIVPKLRLRYFKKNVEFQKDDVCR